MSDGMIVGVLLGLILVGGVGFGVGVTVADRGHERERRRHRELLEAVADEDAGWMAWFQSSCNYFRYDTSGWEIRLDSGQSYKAKTFWTALKKARHAQGVMKELAKELREIEGSTS